jgi:RNase P protein component
MSTTYISPKQRARRLVRQLYELSQASGFHCVIAVQTGANNAVSASCTSPNLENPILLGLAIHLQNARAKWGIKKTIDLLNTEDEPK